MPVDKIIVELFLALALGLPALTASVLLFLWLCKAILEAWDDVASWHYTHRHDRHG